MDKALLDTDIFSEIFKRIDRRVAARATAYRHAFGGYTLSVITVLEVVKGWQKLHREDRIQRFLVDISDAEVLALDRATAEIAGRICGDLERTGQPIGLADAMIAATALQHNLTLVTGNISHYQRIQGLGYSLKLDNWRT
ncbi:MAG: type II toxin-antitoxin system VapC family toxin [Oscillatoria princeps RMCB-10]|nr:type II toxin-antitoxin system VapC family toxin [Oscillatoria princeps RMCB-10]